MVRQGSAPALSSSPPPGTRHRSYHRGPGPHWEMGSSLSLRCPGCCSARHHNLQISADLRPRVITDNGAICYPPDRAQGCSRVGTWRPRVHILQCRHILVTALQQSWRGQLWRCPPASVCERVSTISTWLHAQRRFVYDRIRIYTHAGYKLHIALQAREQG